MIQRTTDITNENELFWMICSLKDTKIYTMSRTVFIQLFFSRFTEDEARKIIDLIQKEIPRAKIVAMSLYGNNFVGLNSTKFLRFSFCLFDESDVTILTYDSKYQKYDEIVSGFQKNLSAIEDAAGVLIFGSGLNFKISRFLEEATAGFEKIPFFGSVANINAADANSIPPYAFGNKMISNGVIAVVFSGKKLHFHTDYLFAWKPIGKKFVVESEEVSEYSEKNRLNIGDTILKKIDGLPAVQIYQKYFDVSPNPHFVPNICEFPLAVERDGIILARVPLRYNEEGALNTMGDVKNGEKVRFTYGKVDEILRESHEACLRMKEFSPEAIFLFVCANRTIFMKDRSNEEISDYQRLIRGTVHCHGFAELYRYKGKGGVFNSTLVTVGVREGEEGEREIKKWSSGKGDYSDLSGLFSHGSKNQNPNQKTSGKNPEDDPDYNKIKGDSIPLSERLVTFLEATTEDLRQATVKANAASEAKSAFLSNMSHEIRTPINAVLGLDEIILRESTEPNIRNYARDIQSSGKSLLSIINDILDSSKIESGKMEIINADYDLRQTIKDLTIMLETRAKAKGLDFIIKVDENMPHLLNGDETRIKQCALNILTNAVKYTQKGSVTLTVDWEKVRNENGENSTSPAENDIILKISVKDTGIGIKEEDLPKLFKPFERIEEKRNRSIEGTGLGMSIVNGLLSQMGSRLEVKSVYGEGSDFSFKMRQQVRSWEKIGSKAEALIMLERETSVYTESFQAPEAKILVVDDTPLNLTVFKGLLKNTRIQIDTAESAKQALLLLKQKKYDIVFIDHLMPVMDGVEMLKVLRADEFSENQHSVCVALTANAMTGAKESYLSQGFEDYLLKPVNTNSLEEMICHYLPEKLVLKEGDEGFVEAKAKTTKGESKNQGELSSLFTTIFNLDFDEALKNCRGKEVFLDAVKNFRDSIEEKSMLIEEYAQKSDWKNYVILVHALKSSARLIGAGKLSNLAKELEDAGNSVLEGSDSHSLLQEKTPELLQLYREYYVRLEALCGFGGKKNLLTPEQLNYAFSVLRETLSVFDFDTADTVFSELEKYEIPVEMADKYKAIKKAVRNVDQHLAMELLQD